RLYRPPGPAHRLKPARPWQNESMVELARMLPAISAPLEGLCEQLELGARSKPELFSTEIPGARPRTPRSPFRSPAQSVLLAVPNPHEHFQSPRHRPKTAPGPSAPTTIMRKPQPFTVLGSHSNSLAVRLRCFAQDSSSPSSAFFFLRKILPNPFFLVS